MDPKSKLAKIQRAVWKKHLRPGFVLSIVSVTVARSAITITITITESAAKCEIETTTLARSLAHLSLIFIVQSKENPKSSSTLRSSAAAAVMEALTSSVSPSIILAHRSGNRQHRSQQQQPSLSFRSAAAAARKESRLCLFSFPFDLSNNKSISSRKRWRASARSRSAGEDEDDEVERALGMDGNIPGTSDEFVRRVSSRAYDMRRHLNQTLDSSSYDVLENNPWRDDSKPVYVLTHNDNQLCTMKTRQNRSEVERELGLLFSKGGKRGLQIGSKAKQSRAGTNFNMFVEDIREGVLVFEDEDDATKYCDLLQGGGQGCEGIAELEASSVFDICHKMRALAVLFRRGRTPPMPKSLEQNLRARKRSLEDQDTV